MYYKLFKRFVISGGLILCSTIIRCHDDCDHNHEDDIIIAKYNINVLDFEENKQ